MQSSAIVNIYNNSCHRLDSQLQLTTNTACARMHAVQSKGRLRQTS